MFHESKNIEEDYLATMKHLLDAPLKDDRTGVGTRSYFGHQISHDMRVGFPLITTKKVHWKSVVTELLWFLRGDTNIKYLNENGVSIWNEWADSAGDLGPVYGQQWRKFECHGCAVDQVQSVYTSLRSNPMSRRHLLSAWHPGLLPFDNLSPADNVGRERMALAPCHVMFQFNCAEIPRDTRAEMLNAKWNSLTLDASASTDDQFTYLADKLEVPKYYLDLQLYQRSADWMLGVPFNIASYALLLEIFAKALNMQPRYYVHSFGDLHLYSNHIEQAKEQLSRDQRDLPQLKIDVDQSKLSDALYLATNSFSLSPDQFIVESYNPHPSIKAPVAV